MNTSDAWVTANPPGLFVRPTEGLAAWKQVADAIEAAIADSTLRPGQRLPGETHLAEQFGRNRHTIRRALAALAERGLIRSARGSGTFVEAQPLRYPIGKRTRFSEIVSRAGREAVGELLGTSQRLASPELARSLGIGDSDPVLELFTRHRADGIPISVGRSWFPLPRFAGFDRAYAQAASITRAFPKFGVTDYRRLETRLTAIPADAEIAGLLHLSAACITVVSRSVNVDQDGRRIQATTTQFAADRVELVVEG